MICSGYFRVLVLLGKALRTVVPLLLASVAGCFLCGTSVAGVLTFATARALFFCCFFVVFFVYENSASMQGTQIAIANISVHLN